MNEKPKQPEIVEDITPYKTAEFEAFVLWISIPGIVRKTYNLSNEAGERIGIERVRDFGFDVDDTLLKTLLEIKTQSEFAKKFDVNMGTLSEWKHTTYYKKCIAAMIDETCVQRYKKEIDFVFTQKTIKEADAPRVKLWYQLFQDYSDKVVNEVTGPDGADIFEHADVSNEELDRRIKKLIGRLEGGSSEEEQKEESK